MHGAKLWITKSKVDQAVLIAFAHHIAWNSICNPIHRVLTKHKSSKYYSAFKIK